MPVPIPANRASEYPIDPLFLHRWSPRAMTGAEMPAGELLTLFEAARWAPSSRNEQPWRFVVTDRRRSPEAFVALHDSLTPKNQVWAAAAPVLILVTVRLTHEVDDVVNSHAWYDTGQAVGFLTLQATAMGLSSRQMQGFDVARAGAACQVPDPFAPAVVMAIGHAGDPETLSIVAHREAELRPRARRNMDEFVYDATWGRELRATS